MKPNEISAIEISNFLGISFIGENTLIDGLNLINRETRKLSIISYIMSKKLTKFLKTNRNVKALFATQNLYNLLSNDYPNLIYFVVDNPEAMFYKLHQILISKSIFYDNYNFPKKIGRNCEISDTAFCEEGVIIGDNVKIGRNSIIRKGTIIEDNTIIGCGCVIGSEGFQLIKDSIGINQLISHAGGCHIGRNVYIGDNSTICNSVFEDSTFIGENSKIDNLVHVAHNCKIGKNCVLTAGVILSGTTIIKDNVWIAPNSTILNRVVLDENSMIGLGSAVFRNVHAGTTVVGNPAKEI